jgi:hypothetical protein
MKFFFVLLTCISSFLCFGQSSDTNAVKSLVDSINRELDRAVVAKNIPFLQKHIADDFRFIHGTGLVDSRESWIGKAGMPRMQYLSREQDSVSVELHDDIAIVTGSLKVVLPEQSPRYGYIIRYQRVFRRNDVWQMISHHTTMQWDIPRK